jgi:formate dehydrogenase maturation protein FdhE
MKKVSKILVMLAIFGLSVSANAQSTPEAIIKQCPDLPSVANLVASNDDKAKTTIEGFHAKIDELLRRVEKENDSKVAIAGTAGKTDAEKIAKQMTGHSIEELENMSQEDMEKMAQQLIAQQMAAVGKGNTQAKAEDAKSLLEAQTELREINERWQKIDELCINEIKEIAKKIDDIYVKYQKQIDAVPMSGMAFGIEPVYLESEIEQIRKFKNQRDTECYTLWRAQISKIQERIKSKLADVKRYDELSVITLSAQGLTSAAKAMPSIGLSIAEQYLSYTERVTSLPNKE